MSREILVTISGHVGVGKTTLARALEEWLRACGVAVSLNDDDGESAESKSRYQDLRWKGLREKVAIKIVTIHTPGRGS